MSQKLFTRTQEEGGASQMQRDDTSWQSRAAAPVVRRDRGALLLRIMAFGLAALAVLVVTSAVGATPMTTASACGKLDAFINESVLLTL